MRRTAILALLLLIGIMGQTALSADRNIVRNIAVDGRNYSALIKGGDFIREITLTDCSDSVFSTPWPAVLPEANAIMSNRTTTFDAKDSSGIIRPLTVEHLSAGGQFWDQHMMLNSNEQITEIAVRCFSRKEYKLLEKNKTRIIFDMVFDMNDSLIGVRQHIYFHSPQGLKSDRIPISSFCRFEKELRNNVEATDFGELMWRGIRYADGCFLIFTFSDNMVTLGGMPSLYGKDTTDLHRKRMINDSLHILRK